MAYPIDRDLMLQELNVSSLIPRHIYTNVFYFKTASKLFQASRERSLPKVLNYAQKLQFHSSKMLILMLDLFSPPD